MNQHRKTQLTDFLISDDFLSADQGPLVRGLVGVPGLLCFVGSGGLSDDEAVVPADFVPIRIDSFISPGEAAIIFWTTAEGKDRWLRHVSLWGLPLAFSSLCELARITIRSYGSMAALHVGSSYNHMS